MSPTRTRNMLIVLVLLLVASAGFIVAAGESDGQWICQNGAWIKQGNPSGEAPQTGCGLANTNTSQAGTPPIQQEYPTKIIYGTALSSEQIGLAQQDCLDRGGEYKACGNACAPDVEVCIQACAHVCELPDIGATN